MSFLRLSCFFVVGASVLAWSGVASAAEPSQKSAAEALFRNARQAMETGRFGEACPMFAESQRLDPAAGTLMNLAECYAQTGQTASAWVTFTDAARAAAARRRDDWERTANARARELEARLSLLVIEVDRDAAGAPGLAIFRDADEVPRPQWSAPIPVDPGTHTVRAEAQGRRSFSSEVTVGPGPSRVVVRVPSLPTRDAAPLPRVVVAPPRPASNDGWRTVGWASIGVGAAALAAGAVTGGLAWSASADADKGCPSSPCTDRGGLDANDRAHTLAKVSTVGFVAGAALAAAGLTILVFGRDRNSAASVAIAPDPNGFGISLGGRR